MTRELGREIGEKRTLVQPPSDSLPVLRRSAAWCCWTLPLAVSLLGVGHVRARDTGSVIPLNYEYSAIQKPRQSGVLLAVIALRDSDCLEYLWFARNVRLRLAEQGVAPPLILLLPGLPWRTTMTRTAEQSIRRSGFEVIVTSAPFGPFMPRHATPSMVLLDRSRRVRAAFSIPTSPREMYNVIRATKELARSQDAARDTASIRGTFQQ